MIPASTWRSVDFPAPLGPMTASTSRTSPNDTFRNAQNGSALSRANICPSDWRRVVFFVKRRE